MGKCFLNTVFYLSDIGLGESQIGLGESQIGLGESQIGLSGAEIGRIKLSIRHLPRRI
jgi:hypothetical protein